MPEYLHECSHCKHEWEETYSIKADIPNKCPKCNKNKVKRLISSATGSRVELYGRELREHLVSEGKKEAKKLYTNELEYSEFIGRDKYQKLQTKIDKDR